MCFGARHSGPGSSPTGPSPLSQAPRPWNRCAFVSRSATTSVARTVQRSSPRWPRADRRRSPALTSPGSKPMTAPSSRSICGQSGWSMRDSTTAIAASCVLGGLVDPPDVARQGVRRGHRPGDRAALQHGRGRPQQVAQADRVRRPELGHPGRHHRRERAELPAGLERRRQRPAVRHGRVVAQPGQDGGVLRGRPLQPALAEGPRPPDRTTVQRPPHRQHLGAGRDAERLELVAVARRVEAEPAVTRPSSYGCSQLSPIASSPSMSCQASSLRIRKQS